MNVKFLLLVLGISFMLGNGLAAQQTPGSEDGYALESALSVAANHLDNLLANMLASLELVASTPEAAKGDWPGIKAYLRRLGERLPAACFYTLPNGDYYTLELDLTNLNISDRSYFIALKEGKNVLGEQIFSRSTGKKSAVVACPIFVGGKFSGALGASVYLDDLHARLNRELALPAGFTWFVVNGEGTTMLDRDADFIFMNALNQGGASLKTAIEQALQAQRGDIRYELGGVYRQGRFQKLPNLDWWMILVRVEGAEPQAQPQPEFSLQRCVTALQTALSDIDAALSVPFQQANLKDVGESELRKLLAEVVDRNQYLVNASYIDNRGVLRFSGQPEYKKAEGSDISAQEHVRQMLADPKPLLSKAFSSVEGFDAVVLAHPLPKALKNFPGSVSALVRPELLVRDVLRKLALPPEYDLWIMQTDGRIIYDRDPEEIGRLLFSDPLYQGYASLLELGRRIAAEPSGSGEYIFERSFGQPKVIKSAIWDTVQLHGIQWRVVLTQTPYE